MDEMNATSQNSRNEFNEFWDNFQFIPVKWIDGLTSKSRYLVGMGLFVYAILALLTFFPDNGWFAPDFRGGRLLALKHYASLNFILLGWISVVALAIRWRQKISQKFQWLWKEERLDKKEGNLQDEFRQYLNDYQHTLKHKWGGVLIGIFLALLVFILVLKAEMFPFIADNYTPFATVVLDFCALLVLFWLFLTGPFSWAMISTSQFIGKLSQRFSIKVQPGHPDKCGGLKSLGDFGLDTAAPIIVGGLCLAAISVFKLDLDDVARSIARILLMVFVGPFAILTVFLPLWNVHREMVESKQRYQDTYSKLVMALEEAIRINTAEHGKLDEAKIAREKLDILQTLHPENQKYPVWPFHLTSTVLAIISPQIIQTTFEVLSNINGIIEQIKKFFAQFGS